MATRSAPKLLLAAISAVVLFSVLSLAPQAHATTSYVNISSCATPNYCVSNGGVTYVVDNSQPYSHTSTAFLSSFNSPTNYYDPCRYADSVSDYFACEHNLGAEGLTRYTDFTDEFGAEWLWY